MAGLTVNGQQASTSPSGPAPGQHDAFRRRRPARPSQSEGEQHRRGDTLPRSPGPGPRCIPKAMACVLCSPHQLSNGLTQFTPCPALFGAHRPRMTIRPKRKKHAQRQRKTSHRAAVASGAKEEGNHWDSDKDPLIRWWSVSYAKRRVHVTGRFTNRTCWKRWTNCLKREVRAYCATPK